MGWRSVNPSWLIWCIYHSTPIPTQVLDSDPPIIKFDKIQPIKSTHSRDGLKRYVPMFAVTGLLYPEHAHYTYRKQIGACSEAFYKQTSNEVSRVTCQHFCDVTRRCQGYTYFPVTADDARLGATVSTCRLLWYICRQPSPRHRKAITYFHEKPPASTTKPHPSTGSPTASWTTGHLNVNVTSQLEVKLPSTEAVPVRPSMNASNEKAV